MSSPAGRHPRSSGSAEAPAFDMRDLDLIVATDIPGLTLIVETRQEYAEEEVVVVTAPAKDNLSPTAICSFYRQDKAIHFEWFSPPCYTQTATVEEALCLIRTFAPLGTTRLRLKTVWPVSMTPHTTSDKSARKV